MTELEKLLAIEEIKALKARYFRCVDTKEWEGLKAVFSPEPVIDISADLPGCVLTDRAVFVAKVRALFSDCVSVHHGHCPEIELLTEKTAAGIWAMEDMLRWSDSANSEVSSLHGFGHYFETYERINRRWHIKSLKLTRLRVDVVTADKQPAGP